MNYKKTPARVMQMVHLFHQHKLSYILFKCEHIFEGKNKNVDILFETKGDYYQASQLLEKEGFAVKLSEKVEKYKTMYTGLYDGNLYSFHLHREIAWHGMVALDKREVFQRKKSINPLIIIPGLEDSILIHAAHVLFENFRVTKRESIYLKEWKNSQLDEEYIAFQLRRNRWEKGFLALLRYFQKWKKVPFSLFISTWTRKVVQEPSTALYLIRKAARKVLRPLSLEKKGVLLVFIGVNGSGKTTLAKKTLEAYQQITTQVGKQQQYYYFGWHPEFPVTKLLSKINKKTNLVSFKEMNHLKTETNRNHSLKQEIIFFYSWLEFLYRYYKNIHSNLRRGDLIITDRYFYDLYGQNIYSRKSVLLKLLMYLFPKPTYTVLLDTDISTLQQRKKTDKKYLNKITKTKRNLLPATYLQTQRENYFFLAEQHHFPIIDTSKNIEDCSKTIVEKTWKKLLEN